jgi:hypothetical protein
MSILMYRGYLGEDIVEACTEATRIGLCVGVPCDVEFNGVLVKSKHSAAQMVSDYWIATLRPEQRTRLAHRAASLILCEEPKQ